MTIWINPLDIGAMGLSWQVVWVEGMTSGVSSMNGGVLTSPSGKWATQKRISRLIISLNRQKVYDPKSGIFCSVGGGCSAYDEHRDIS